MTQQPPELPGLEELFANENYPTEDIGGFDLAQHNTPSTTTEPITHNDTENNDFEEYQVTDDSYDTSNTLANPLEGYPSSGVNLDELDDITPLLDNGQSEAENINLEEESTPGDSYDLDNNTDEADDNDDDLNKPNKKKRKNKKPHKKASKAPIKIKPTRILGYAKKPLEWLLWLIDRVSIIFYWLQKLPIIGKVFKPLHTGTQLTRIIIGTIIPLLLIGLPLLLIFTGNKTVTIERTYPDGGHVIATNYDPNNTNLNITINNNGAIIDDDVKPNITVTSKKLTNPTTWFQAQPTATCTTDTYTTINPGETTTITLTCDNPIQGVNKAYTGTLTQ